MPTVRRKRTICSLRPAASRLAGARCCFLRTRRPRTRMPRRPCDPGAIAPSTWALLPSPFPALVRSWPRPPVAASRPRAIRAAPRSVLRVARVAPRRRIPRFLRFTWLGLRLRRRFLRFAPSSHRPRFPNCVMSEKRARDSVFCWIGIMCAGMKRLLRNRLAVYLGFSLSTARGCGRADSAGEVSRGNKSHIVHFRESWSRKKGTTPRRFG